MSSDVLWPTRRGRASRGVSCRDSWVAAARRSNIFPIPRSPLPKKRRQVRPTNCRIRYWVMSSDPWTSSKAESSRRHERDSSHDACRRGNTCGRSDTASGLGYEQHEVWDKCEERLRWEKAGLVAQRSWAESRMRRGRHVCVGGRYPTPSSAAHTPRTPRLAQTGATFANTLHLLQTYSQLIPRVLPTQGTSACALDIHILW